MRSLTTSLAEVIGASAPVSTTLPFCVAETMLNVQQRTALRIWIDRVILRHCDAAQ